MPNSSVLMNSAMGRAPDSCWDVETRNHFGRLRAGIGRRRRIETDLFFCPSRVERLEVEKTEIMEQMKEVYAEAKGNGFDVKILKKVVRLRKQDRAKRQEEDAILDLYLSAIGEI